MLIGDFQNKGIFSVAEKWKMRCMSIGKPASCLLQFSCQCRSNMIVDYAVAYYNHYKMNMPCPSSPAVAVSGLWRAGRVAVHGADWGRYTVRCCCICHLKGKSTLKLSLKLCYSSQDVAVKTISLQIYDGFAQLEITTPRLEQVTFMEVVR